MITINKNLPYIKIFLYPFSKYAIFFWLMTMMLFLPMYFWDRYNVPLDSRLVIRLTNDVILSGMISYLLLFVGSIIGLLSQKTARIWVFLSYFLVWVFSYGETFMIKIFRTRYSSFIFQVVDETKGKETQEFILAVCVTFKFFAISFLYIGILGIFAYLIYRVLENKSWNRILGKISFIIFSIIIIGGLFFNSQMKTGYAKIPFGWDSFSKFHKAYLSFRNERENFRLCDQSHLNIEIDSCNYTSPKIVLMIGESYIKRHSPLYGYVLNTTPFLCSLDSLFVFNDVITSVNMTTLAIRNMISMSSVGEGKEWYDSPYFMSYFKKSGYHVTYYSNQYPYGGTDFDGGFLDMPILNDACFSFRNSKEYQYDGDFLDHYEKDRDSIDVGEHWLSIIHFMGQHMLAAERYPKTFTTFTSDSIPRMDLNDSQRQEIAYYDNATLYNDEMVKRVVEMYRDQEVIFVYIADHGDEVYDFRMRSGRIFDINSGANMLHCHIDVPMFIYATPLYRERHPDIINRIGNSLDNPFMSDDLPHLMLDLAGIYTPLYKPEKSLINPCFDKTRKRLIGYDEKYDYDEICNKE